MIVSSHDREEQVYIEIKLPPFMVKKLEDIVSYFNSEDFSNLYIPDGPYDKGLVCELLLHEALDAYYNGLSKARFLYKTWKIYHEEKLYIAIRDYKEELETLGVWLNSLEINVLKEFIKENESYYQLEENEIICLLMIFTMLYYGLSKQIPKEIIEVND